MPFAIRSVFARRCKVKALIKRGLLIEQRVKGISYRICGLIQLSLIASGVYRNGNTVKGA